MKFRNQEIRLTKISDEIWIMHGEGWSQGMTSWEMEFWQRIEDLETVLAYQKLDNPHDPPPPASR